MVMAGKWDIRFLDLARHIAGWSRDPSTKVGAVIVNPERRVVATGYNGFPAGVADTDERLNDRETKYKLVVHAEANAILNAVGPVRGASIFVWPLFSCSECAKLIIQSGIKRLVSPPPKTERWQSSYDTALKMYEEAGVTVEFLNV